MTLEREPSPPSIDVRASLLARLSDAAVVAARMTSVQAVGDHIVRTAVTELRVDIALLWRTDSRNGQLRLAASTVGSDLPVGSTTAPADTLVGTVVCTKTLIEWHRARHRAGQPTPFVPGYASAVAVPVVADGAAIGALMVARRRPSPFARAEKDALQILAALAAPRLVGAELQESTNRALREAHEARAQLELIFATAPVVVIVLDARGELEYIDGQPLRATGHTPEDFIGRPIQDIYARTSAVAEAAEAALAGRVGPPIRFSAEGAEWEVLYLPRVGAAGSITGAVGVAFDVTDRTAAARAAAESAAKTKFLAQVSHELRTPITTVLGFAQLLQRPEMEAMTERQSRYVKNVELGANQVVSLVNDLLDLSKVNAGKLEFRIREIDLPELVTATAEQLAPLASSKGIEIETLLDPVTCMADPLRLQQVVTNLVQNAIKFTDSGRVTIVTRCQRSSRHVLLEVSDTGIGINRRDLKRVFDEFVQLDETGHRPGTGLGLALSRKLVESMGGDLTVRSKASVGSTFRVRLPAPATRSDAPQVPAPSGGG